jgi:hypothetical protein
MSVAKQGSLFSLQGCYDHWCRHKPRKQKRLGSSKLLSLQKLQPPLTALSNVMTAHISNMKSPVQVNITQEKQSPAVLL